MSRARLAVGSVTVLGALLRFPTLDAKSWVWTHVFGSGEVGSRY